MAILAAAQLMNGLDRSVNVSKTWKKVLAQSNSVKPREKKLVAI